MPLTYLFFKLNIILTVLHLIIYFCQHHACFLVQESPYFPLTECVKSLIYPELTLGKCYDSTETLPH